MDRTTRPTSGNTTFHRDNSVTVWDCELQSWVRGRNPCAGLLATLDRAERVKVICHTGIEGQPLGHEGEYGMYLCDDCCEYVSVDDSCSRCAPIPGTTR